MTPTMRAMIAGTPGPPDVLELQHVPVPEPAAGQALVRVAYTALNPLDTHARAARVDYMAPEFPFTPGYEFSGLVEADGDGVDPEPVGRRVVSEGEWGGCAEYALATADRLITIPDGFAWQLGTVYHTCVYSSWHILHTAGRIRKRWVSPSTPYQAPRRASCRPTMKDCGRLRSGSPVAGSITAN